MSEISGQEQQYSKTRVGLMLAAVMMMVVISGFGNFKFVPMQNSIMDFFHIQESAYGYLNTASGWATVLCAVPFGFLVRKLRCNVSIIIGISVAAVGIFIQATTTSFVVMVIGRVIEGAGSSFAGLVTAALTLNLVNPKRLSFWSSVFVVATIMPQVIMAKGGTALMINSGLSFQQIFRIIAFIYLGAIIVWLILVPFSLKIHGVGSSVKPTREQTLRVIKNKSNWLVAIANIFFNLVSITFTAYIIKYLMTKGLTQHSAANYYSLTTILGLASMIIFGILSDKLKTKRKIAVMSCFAAAVSFVLLAVLPGNLIIIYVLVWGTLPRSVAVMVQSSSADIAEVPTDIPIVNSVKSTIMQVGSIITGILLGYMIQYLGYDISIFVLAGGMVIAAILWMFAKRIP